jgi:hypothetical protein
VMIAVKKIGTIKATQKNTTETPVADTCNIIISLLILLKIFQIITFCKLVPAKPGTEHDSHCIRHDRNQSAFRIFILFREHNRKPSQCFKISSRNLNTSISQVLVFKKTRL